MSYKIKISTILDEQLKSKGITLVKLSENTGIKYARLVSWRHKNNPRVGPELIICAIYFNISLAYLLFGEDQPEPRDEGNLFL